VLDSLPAALDGAIGVALLWLISRVEEEEAGRGTSPWVIADQVSECVAASVRATESVHPIATVVVDAHRLVRKLIEFSLTVPSHLAVKLLARSRSVRRED